MRIGLIGAGANMRARHIPGFRAIPGVEVVSVANRTPESSARAAAESGIPTAAASPEDLIADPNVDAVCIGTWPYRHREYTIRALEAGKHVLCEARMAMDATEAEDMFEASQANPGLVAQLVPAPFDFRTGPTIARLLREGAIGDIYEAHVTVHNGSGIDPFAPIHWRNQRVYSGRNVMTLGIYNEVIQRWLGDTERVLADGAVYVPERPDPSQGGAPAEADVPDSYTVVARMANGARAVYSFSAMAAGAPWNGIAIFGSKATIRWTPNSAGGRDGAMLVPHGGEATPIEPDPGSDRGWQVEADFVDSVRTGAPVRLTNFSDGLKYMRFTDAAYRSWQTGQAQDCGR